MQKRGQVILISIIAILILAIATLTYLYLSQDKVDCGRGVYNSELEKCVYRFPGLITECPRGFSFNRIRQVCERTPPILRTCDEGIYNSETGYCEIELDTEYVCEGEIDEIDGELVCVVDISDNKTCSQLNGNICLSSESCSGSWLSASDNSRCCGGSCEGEGGDIDYEDSPFCIWGASLGLDSEGEAINLMQDLGVGYATLGVGKFGNFELESTYAGSGISHTIVPWGLLSYPYQKGPTLEGYYQNVYAAGLHDTPMHFYFMGVEMAVPANVGWEDDINDNERGSTYFAPYFAIDTRIAYRALKDANPKAKLLPAGGTMKEDYFSNTAEKVPFFDVYLEALEYMEEIENNITHNRGTNYIDYYDGRYDIFGLKEKDLEFLFQSDNYDKYLDGLHFSNFDNDLYFTKKNTESYADAVHELFNKYGYDYENMHFWNTQTGLQSSCSNDEFEFGDCPKQSTEHWQAEFNPRKQILSLVNGIEKVCWIDIKEINWLDSWNHYFTLTQFIYNGEGLNDLGEDVKKLSYYSYKLMTEKLEGSDWDNIDNNFPDLPGNVYAYKFTKKSDGSRVYVVWWDYWNEPTLSSKTISLSDLGISGTVTITGSVPHFENGLILQESGESFEEIFDTETSSNSITLGESPVYLE